MYKDYTQFTNECDNVFVEETTVEEVVESEIVEEIGVVFNCQKLNIRKEASKDSEVVKVVDVKTELLVNITESTEKFYKVCLASGLEGYCMKEFISIR